MHFSSDPYSHIAKVIFVGDPMCSWCYGFGPELTRLRETLKKRPFRILMGGLRDGERFDAAKLKRHLGYWEDVAKETALPFDATALSQEGFIYTTEPACRAVVTMRELSADLEYALYHALQKAFYAEGRDVTRSEVIADVAVSLGVDRRDFLRLFESKEMLKATQDDKQRAETYGVRSFPTLIIIDKQGHMSQIRGYRPYDALIALIKS